MQMGILRLLKYRKKISALSFKKDWLLLSKGQKRALQKVRFFSKKKGVGLAATAALFDA